MTKANDISVVKTYTKVLLVSESMLMLVVASWRQSFSVSFAIQFLHFDLTCFKIGNILLPTYFLSMIDHIFTTKFFSLENLSLLSNFQELS